MSVAQRPLRVGPRVWVRASGCGARLGIRPNRRGEEDRGKAGRPPEGKRRRGSSSAPPVTLAGRSCPYGGEQRGVARTVRRGGRSEVGARWWGFRGGGGAREAGGHGEGNGAGQEWAQGAGRHRGGPERRRHRCRRAGPGGTRPEGERATVVAGARGRGGGARGQRRRRERRPGCGHGRSRARRARARAW